MRLIDDWRTAVDRAVEAATKVEKKATVCTEQNGYWDVITQDCKLEGAQ